jgi:peptidoglycan/LPS O-acetylase OafA/YrhL
MDPARTTASPPPAAPRLPPVLLQKHFPSLDGLRAIAILGVIFSHILYEDQSVFIRRTGAWSVNLFFVLSGILITTLLMRERERHGRISFKAFYARRSLRIFPAAALYLLVMAVLNVPFDLGIGLGDFLKATFYLQNLPIPVDGNRWYLAHFWSLSVEEQYYLIAPALLSVGLLIFRRAALAVIVAAHVVIYAIYHGHGDSVALAYVDAIIKPIVPLTLGSLAAELTLHGAIRPRAMGTPATLAVLVASYLVFCGVPPIVPKLFLGTASAILLTWLVLSLINPSDSLVFKFLNSRVMTEIGVTSYSLYIWQQAFTHNGFLYRGPSAVVTAIVNLVLLALVASLSYRYFERYFLNLKERFSRA